MHYIRFLKTPKVTVAAGKVTLTANITITTDLGETFYEDDLDLATTLRSPDRHGDIFLRRTIKWTAGSRSLPLSFDLTRSEIEWPARLHVGLKNGQADLADDFELFSSRPNHETAAIVTVWSESLDATKGIFEAPRQVERKFSPLSGRSLTIWEDTGDSIARHLWDGSVALTAYIDRVIALQAPTAMPALEHALISATFKRLNVIELGCGCGIVGIALAQSIPDCDVLLTDFPEVEELVERNMAEANLAISSRVGFAPLDWEKKLPPRVANKNFDIIVAAECIYNSDSIPPLVKTIKALITRSPKAIAIIATKFRHETELEFFNLAAEAGLVTASKTQLPLPGRAGIGYGDFSTDVGLHILVGAGYRASYTPIEELERAFEVSSGSE
ncbi:putative methyltransferase-domain-containing protein [Elsinoe ampelina]|uniref:Putative methyltransferase-domain-containing protein n=1 Tax=Elsinoe ampelina TaxID=302913 RepID=A0A6A6G784_9PEZI|nr:putative methyltransferase-domain-containing protein [Elsinoe ampelina]